MHADKLENQENGTYPLSIGLKCKVVVDLNAPPNNGMHPALDTTALKFSGGAGGQLMPGVRWLLNVSNKHYGKKEVKTSI